MDYLDRILHHPFRKMTFDFQRAPDGVYMLVQFDYKSKPLNSEHLTGPLNRQECMLLHAALRAAADEISEYLIKNVMA